MTIQYAGVTVGPVLDTISRATVPAALWFSSMVFSDLTRRLCREITETIPGARIISPCYDPSAEGGDGAGLYHDRIFLSAETARETLRESLDAASAKVRRETAGLFPGTYDRERTEGFLNGYIGIQYVILSEDEIGRGNAVRALSPYLDALELMRTFPPTSGDDPFAALFAGDGSGRGDTVSRNEAIRMSPLFPKKDRRYLVSEGGGIRSIGEIAAGGGDPQRKHAHYYAVVSADGDDMGRFLEGLENGEIEAFSAACLEYAAAASELVFGFGGMPIYAGGDDLLFLAPVCGELGGRRAAVTDLCREIGEMFSAAVRSAFRGEDRDLRFPTISFGISVQYEKYPLYEALAQGRELLAEAKSGPFRNGGETLKDNIALNLQKHSGQSLGMIIHGPDHAAFAELSGAAAGADGTAVNAVLTTIGTHEALLRTLCAETEKSIGSMDTGALRERFLAAWANLFDNPGQAVSRNYAEGIGRSFFDRMIAGRARIAPLEGSGAVQALRSILGWEKFLKEKAGDEG